MTEDWNSPLLLAMQNLIINEIPIILCIFGVWYLIDYLLEQKARHDAEERRQEQLNEENRLKRQADIERWTKQGYIGKPRKIEPLFPTVEIGNRLWQDVQPMIIRSIELRELQVLNSQPRSYRRKLKAESLKPIGAVTKPLPPLSSEETQRLSYGDND